MKISFHGADRGVTGSCHRLECGRTTLLVDCGLFQGARDLDEENSEQFGFDPARIDHVLLTHAHLDHCGRLPLLYKRGFRGEIIATSATRELARVVLFDAARLEEDEFAERSRRTNRPGARQPAAPLFTTQDARDVLDRFGRTARYGAPIGIAPGVGATFLDAGHILGSACIRLQLEHAGEQRSVLFSGDIGNSGRPLLRDPAPAPKADVLVMETTYGDRLHRSLPASVEELFRAIEDTFRRGGNVVIPTFALERAQEVLFYLREAVEAGRIPPATPVFLDSPMAISATEIFRRHPECYDAETAALFREGNDPMHVPGLRLTRTTSESSAINRIDHGAIILAGSGMATGGRVRHHLRHNIGREESSVIFVGFAVQGTLARKIIDGAKSVRLFGDEIPVRCRVHTINGFSAHADQAELLAWRQHIGASRTFLVHGEEDVMRKFALDLHDTAVAMPALGDEFEL